MLPIASTVWLFEAERKGVNAIINASKTKHVSFDLTVLWWEIRMAINL